MGPHAGPGAAAVKSAIACMGLLDDRDQAVKPGQHAQSRARPPLRPSTTFLACQAAVPAKDFQHRGVSIAGRLDAVARMKQLADAE